MKYTEKSNICGEIWINIILLEDIRINITFLGGGGIF